TPHQMIDLAAARKSEDCSLLLQPGDREPCLAPRKILRGFEYGSIVKHHEAAGLEQQADQKWIAVKDGQKLIQIDLARLRQPRMVDDFIKRQPQRAADKPLELGLLHPAPAPHPPSKA